MNKRLHYFSLIDSMQLFSHVLLYFCYILLYFCYILLYFCYISHRSGRNVALRIVEYADTSAYSSWLWFYHLLCGCGGTAGNGSANIGQITVSNSSFLTKNSKQTPTYMKHCWISLVRYCLEDIFSVMIVYLNSDSTLCSFEIIIENKTRHNLNRYIMIW